jgi:hypothetical protein
MAGYSGTPLARKLGIAGNSRLLFIHAPRAFAIDVLPAGVVAHRRATAAPYDTILLFTSDRRTLLHSFPAAAKRVATAGGVWVCWPKKASGVPTDLRENDVREFGLASGLVDVKVCAIDETWSGLRFVRRLADR